MKFGDEIRGQEIRGKFGDRRDVPHWSEPPRPALPPPKYQENVPSVPGFPEGQAAVELGDQVECVALATQVLYHWDRHIPT